MSDENKTVTDESEETAGVTEEAQETAGEDAAQEEAQEETGEEEVSGEASEEEAEDEEAEDEEAEGPEEKKTKKKKEKAQPTNSSGDIILKKKRRLSSTAIVAICVAAAMVLAIVIYFGIRYDWYHMIFPLQDNMTMEDYSTIEIEQSVIDEVDDDLVQDSIDDMLEYFETTETITEGTVEEGDEIYISYVGTIDGEEFDGGTSDGTTITVGSSGYIDGFDDGLIGVEIGDTVDLDLTFPDDYDDEDLAGQDVVFTVTIEYLSETITPDLTDDWVSENSDEYWGEQIDTVDDLYEYVYEYLYTYYLHSAMLDALQELQTVVTYGQENFDLLYDYAYEELAYYATYYGMDVDTLAYYYGYTDADSYATSEAIYYDDLVMLFNYLWEDLNLDEYTDGDVEDALQEYYEENGYDDYYDSLEDFKEASGEGWLLIYEGIQYKYDIVMEALESRVVFVETEEEETETDEDADEEETETDEDADSDEEDTDEEDTDEEDTEDEE